MSDIPFAGPVGAVRVGRVNGQFVLNPTHSQRAKSDLDLVYVGNKSEVIMIEGAANELPEAEFIKHSLSPRNTCRCSWLCRKSSAPRLAR
ncbi:hypothetical protein [Verrucomicrobium spinosum]|uniref:hypothetical protein n=1 Tax=Verrucomicrobium spinosum TaxID=2736 RepID=UPI000B1AD6C9|nr:hypothetical protein [Verrucomicrobium spinosum]